MKKAVLIAAAGFAIGLGGFLYFKQRPLFTRFSDGRIVPPWGLLGNSQSLESTSPKEAERKFKKIYKAIIAYRTRHGKLPIAASQLLGSSLAKNERLTKDDLVLSDFVYSDHYAKGYKDDASIALELLAPRPRGIEKPAYPKAGEKDAWLSTNIYVRSNTKFYPDWTVTNQYDGFFLVLWSNGTVERVPYENQLWLSFGNSLEPFFVGQAGLTRKEKTDSMVKSIIQGATPSGFGNPNGPRSR